MSNNLNITIDDFNLICRLCLKKDSRRLKPIFKSNMSEDDEKEQTKSQLMLPANQMITEFCGLEIHKDDGFPLLICSRCLNKLIDCHSFRATCLSSATILFTIKQNINQNVSNDTDGIEDYFENTGWPDFSDDDDCKDDIIQNKHSIIAPNEKKFEEYTFKTQTINDNTDQNTIIQSKHSIIHSMLINDDREPNLLNDSPASNRQRKRNAGKKKSTKKLKNQKKEPVKMGRKPLSIEEKKLRKKNRNNRGEICEICGILSKNMHSHYASHLDINQVNVECDYCGKKFITKNNLQQHLRIHLNNRKHQCTLCSYKFVQKAHLNRHMYTHTDEKPYKCSICNKGFKQSGTMKTHEKIHFQNRDIACPHCDKLFLTKSNLKSHIGIHTGERPYKCEICGVGFIASSTLAIHRRKHKPTNPNNECYICHMTFSDPLMLRSHQRDHGINDARGRTVIKIITIPNA